MNRAFDVVDLLVRIVGAVVICLAGYLALSYWMSM